MIEINIGALTEARKRGKWGMLEDICIEVEETLLSLNRFRLAIRVPLI